MEEGEQRGMKMKNAEEKKRDREERKLFSP